MALAEGLDALHGLTVHRNRPRRRHPHEAWQIEDASWQHLNVLLFQQLLKELHVGLDVLELLQLNLGKHIHRPLRHRRHHANALSKVLVEVHGALLNLANDPVKVLLRGVKQGFADGSSSLPRCRRAACGDALRVRSLLQRMVGTASQRRGRHQRYYLTRSPLGRQWVHSDFPSYIRNLSSIAASVPRSLGSCC
ncbi:hypothetical protein TraAM80_04605 [Trypanosoma rangeli]|uniref:Uncharacterized protein n=1 Tax=Trypanosoma rangeli TaxID=5698 RepID=A0A422NIV9_TRYRA|nr:uncharacterized protein TraAM80_04605 [Trypanosoma rangeli]RNF05395.1 hypothetical protein TraAM80_04605 [Trypanosoma rangeli]|eukprot:RNF05395.1 hypothetical protein TraAM80_04605 [Trypanosoma rangeli]